MTPETITQGRNLCLAKDLDGLMAWLRRNVPTLDQKMARSTFSACFRANDTEKALKILAVFDDYDVVKEAGGILLTWVVLALVVLGLLGGVVYLFKAVF